MLGMYNIGEVTRAFQMLSEYEMLCEEYQVEKVLRDYYSLLALQYNVLGEQDVAKGYMYEGRYCIKIIRPTLVKARYISM